MAKKNINVSIPAGAEVDVLQDWQWQIPPRKGEVRLLAWSTATGLNHELTSLNTTILQKCPVSAGAAANVLPSVQFVDPVIEKVPALQKLSLMVSNTTGGALPYLATIDYDF